MNIKVFFLFTVLFTLLAVGFTKPGAQASVNNNMVSMAIDTYKKSSVKSLVTVVATDYEQVRGQTCKANPDWSASQIKAIKAKAKRLCNFTCSGDKLPSVVFQDGSVSTGVTCVRAKTGRKIVAVPFLAKNSIKLIVKPVR